MIDTTPESAVSHETPIPVIESVTPAPVVTCNPVIEYVPECRPRVQQHTVVHFMEQFDAAHAAPALVTEHAAPARAGACAAPFPALAVQIPHIQGTDRCRRDDTGLCFYACLCQ